jgi:hypothetical protein
VSTPSAPPPPADSVPPAASVPPAPPAPAVPYGPGPGEPADASPFSTTVTAEGAAKGVGRTAVKWGIRILLPLLIRALFRALTRR